MAYKYRCRTRGKTMARTVFVVEDTSEDSALYEILIPEYRVQIVSSDNMLSELLSNRQSVSLIIINPDQLQISLVDGLEYITGNGIFRQIPIFVIAEEGNKEIEKTAVAFGVHGIISSPFNGGLVLNQIRNIIGLREFAMMANSGYRDYLTGLYSRRAFIIESQRRIKRKRETYSIGYLNVENFKLINDLFGIEAGDKVLVHIARILEVCVEEMGGICSRIMGDHFGILYPAGKGNTSILLDSYNTLSMPSVLNKGIKLRIGKLDVMDTEVSIDTLLDWAAMAADSITNNRDIVIAEYDSKMRDDLIHQKRVMDDMESALEENEFEPWYQPIYNNTTGEMVGAEALVRWNNKRLKQVWAPDKFLPILEKNRFIHEVDKAIWEQICKKIKSWIKDGYEPVPVAINVSQIDLVEHDLVSELTGLIKKYEIPSRYIRVEIAESIFERDVQAIIAVAEKLINHGITVEIDGFGSAYSSLNILKDVPAQVLKIDVSFLSKTKKVKKTEIILKSIVGMAKLLNIDVIVEGVETKEQADFLESIQCEIMQGYWFAKPMCVEDFQRFLQRS